MAFGSEAVGYTFEEFFARSFCGLSSNFLSLIRGQRCGFELLLPACCWCKLFGQWPEICARAAYVTLSEVASLSRIGSLAIVPVPSLVERKAQWTTGQQTKMSLQEQATRRSGVKQEDAFAIDDVNLFQRLGLETFIKLSTNFYTRSVSSLSFFICGSVERHS